MRLRFALTRPARSLPLLVGIALLFSSIVPLALGRGDLANIVAFISYFFLVLGVAISVVELSPRGSSVFVIRRQRHFPRAIFRWERLDIRKYGTLGSCCTIPPSVFPLP